VVCGRDTLAITIMIMIMTAAVIVIVIVIVIPAPVAVAIPVPVMVVVPMPALAFPTTLVIAFPIIPRRHPVRASIRSAGPVCVMPFVVVPDRIPVAVNPKEIRPRASRDHANDARGWRWADYYSDRNLAENRTASQQHQREKSRFQVTLLK